MKPNFMDRTAKIIEEIRNRSRINVVDTEVIEAMLKDALNEECRMLDSYYWAEYNNKYCNEISSVRNGAYEAGYDEGYADGHSESHSAV